MNDEQLLRYSRQIMMPEIDVAGQQRLLDATALIVGLGGLGSPVAMYLAAAGVGHLILVDFDPVELSNLQRQIIHFTTDLGRPKVESAKARLLALNPECRVTALNQRLTEESLREEIAAAQVVIDCSDNFTTRFALNRACVAGRTPLISGAATRFEGQVSVYVPRDPQSPCYRCLYDEVAMAEETCTQTGVVAPLLGIVGSVQAMEAIKVITGAGEPLVGRLLILDALSGDWNLMRFRRDPACPVCAQRP